MTISTGIICMDNRLISTLKVIPYGWCHVLERIYHIRYGVIIQWTTILTILDSLTVPWWTTRSNLISSSSIPSNKWVSRINLDFRIRWCQTTVADKVRLIISLSSDNLDGQMNKWDRLNRKERKEEREVLMDRISRCLSSFCLGILENKSIS